MNGYIERCFFDITRVSDLPVPKDLETPACMVGGISTWKRAWRQWRPDPRPRDCCEWFHAGSWAEASQHAINLVDGISMAAAGNEDPFDPIRDRLRAAGLTGWLHEAVRSLTCGGEPINYGTPRDRRLGYRGFVGGRHRALAMMQQGCRTTVTFRWELIDFDTKKIID